MRQRTLFSWLIVGMLIMLSSLPGQLSAALAAPASPKTLLGTEPEVVAHGAARRLAQRNAGDAVDFSVGLPLRNAAGLDAFLAGVSDPASPLYHRYLSQDEANAQFNPTLESEARVVRWLQAHGITVTATYPNHLMVGARGSVAEVEHLFGVTLNTYRITEGGKQRDFVAPDRNPVVDASVSDVVSSIVGLDTYSRFHTGLLSNGSLHLGPPYFPQDIATAYDVGPLWSSGTTGAGQHIGITLWTAPPSDGTLQAWGTTTGAAVATTANGRLNVIHVCDGSICSSAAADMGEAAMDIEWSGAVAPAATIDYYEAPTDSAGNPTGQGLLNALNSAGSDGNNNRQISNSWSECEPSSTLDAFASQAESIFATNSATGHTYFFATGDNGSWCGSQDPWANFPAGSPYVTAVGGTTFNTNLNGGYPGERAWTYTPGNPLTGTAPEGSGGGYSSLYGRPSWQTGIGLATNGRRGYPDVSAVADPVTGVYVCYGTSPSCANQWGGTSLSTPILAGMTALFNGYLTAQGKGALGFLSPTLYSLANVPQSYPAFHDITSGTNGSYSTGTGWDAVTGEGSPDAWNMARDLAGTGPSGTATATATPTNTATATSTVPATSTATPTPTATRTPTPTSTLAPSSTPTVVTPTATATRTPTSTPGTTATAAPTATSAPTVTNTPTVTPTPTRTATPTPTVAPTSTATPAVTSTAFTAAATGTDGTLLANHGGGFVHLGGTLIGAPAVVSAMLNGSRSDLYLGVGQDQNLYERTDTVGWQLLGSGPCVDSPAAAVNGNTLLVACTEANGSVYYGSTTLPASGLPALGALTSLGGLSTVGPALVLVNGTPTVFMTGMDHHLSWRTPGGTWTVFSGITCSGHPAAAGNGPASYVACRSSLDNAIWQAANTGSGWGAFSSLGGMSLNGPGLAATGAGPVTVMQGLDNALYTNSGSGWQSIGGVVTGGASAAADPAGAPPPTASATPTASPTPTLSAPPSASPTRTPTTVPTNPPTATPTRTPTPVMTPTPTATPGSGACPGSQSGCIQAMLNLLNADRAGAGVPPLTLNSTQTNGTGSCVGSYGHSVHMAAMGTISHDQFPADICIPFLMAGENVGEGGTGNELTDLQQLDQLMMGEAHDPVTCGTTGNHACNIINPSYHQVGIGIYNVNNVTWLTEDFTN